ncbi:GNAT family N-acetyltransferase [Bacillus sp. T33-2]|nr:GNAT family N-acetyltransferase [Bacillus sp. T33-2]
MKIRPERQEDIAKIDEVVHGAFGRSNEARLVELIRNSENFIPGLSLVAENENDEIVGHILFSKITIESAESKHTTVGLAPMAVKPGFQGQGIGSELVREGLNRCTHEGFTHAVVLGHPQFYPKFGFLPSVRFNIESPFPVPEDVFMAVELEEGSLTNIQGRVKYPPAFGQV